MGRFAASPADGGVYVLDTESGEVVFVSREGHSRVLRPAVSTETGRSLSVGTHPIDDVVLATFPSPVAWAWQDYLVESEARQKTRALVDCFSVLLKQWAFTVTAAVFASPGLRDADLHRLLGRELQRPLISSWQRVIETSLPLLERHADPSARAWVESFGRVYSVVQTKCRQRVTMPRPYLDQQGELCSNDAKFGWVEALLALRNELAHRALASSEVAHEDIGTFEPVMRNLLSAAAELSPWQLVEVDASAPGGARAPLVARPWTGRHGRGAPFEVQRPRRLPAFTGNGCVLGVAARDGSWLPLPVFYGRDARGEGVGPAQLLSFDGATARGIRYVAGDGTRRDDQRPLAAWTTLVSSVCPPTDSLALDGLTWAAFVQRCCASTQQTLEGFRARNIYHPDLDVPRDAIEGAFQELLDERRAMVLAGSPGVGKTFALASLAHRRMNAGDAVTLLRAAELQGVTPAAQVANALGFPLGTAPEQIAARLAALAERTGRWLLLVDGLESASPGAAEWLAATQHWASATRGVDAFRVVVSTRTMTLDSAPRGFAPGTGDLFVRRPRRDDAEPEASVFVGTFDRAATEDAYERHRKHAIAEGLGAPTTRYAELGAKSNVHDALRDPVSMRLLIRAYAGRALPSELPWEEAIGLFLERTVRDPTLADGGPRWKYLEAIVEWCSRASVDELGRDQLADHTKLGPAVFDTSAESPYGQLLELGVLVEEWRDARCVVAVSPNILFEHVLAAQLQCTSADRILGSIRRLDGMRAAPGAWVVALRQAIRNGSGKVLCDALDACDHGRWQAARGPLLGALVEVLANLVEHDEAALECFLETLAEVPSRTDVTLLLDTFERARAKGRRRAMGLVVEALQRETATWDDVHLHNEVLVRDLEMCLEGSDGARTASVMASLQVALDSGAAPDLAARAEVCLGRVQGAAGRFSFAGEHFERAQRLALELGRLGAASDACRWRSASESNLGNSQHALELANEALRIARDCGDKAREGAAYHRLATVEHSLGERTLARDHYDRALVLHRMTEHTAHAAATALNLGVLLIDNQEVERAREVIESALVGFEEMGHARGLSPALVNLALLARMRGDTDSAVSLVLRAREIDASRMSPVELARDLWLLAELALDSCDLAGAKAYRDELLTFDLADPARRSVWALHLAALDLRANPTREGGVTDVIRHWNATAKCGVYLNPDERPVALLRELAARPVELRGLGRVLECLERGATMLEWETQDE